MSIRISAAALAGVTLALTCGVGAAAATDLSVRPRSVPPAGKLTVEGTCPEPTGDSFTSATVGIDSLNRYAFVPVAADGTFHATVHVKPMGSAEAPAVGDNVTVVATCRTAAAFVASAGTVDVKVVEKTSTPSRTQTAVVRTSNSAAPTATAAAASSSNGGDGSVPATVPLIAFAVAVVGTLGAYLLSRRSDRRAAAMAGHPAQRGVGRDAPRDRK